MRGFGAMGAQPSGGASSACEAHMQARHVRTLLMGCALACLVALGCAFALLLQPHAALAETDYTYTIRIFGGNHGTVNVGTPGSGNYVVYSEDYAYGDSVTLPNPSGEGVVNLNASDNGKYYVKGYRLSGHDALDAEVHNSAGLHELNFDITEDTDLIVVYGVRGAMVPYTVHFVEYGTGTPLANEEGQTSRTYEGKVGDKPVVAYDYIPGYRPLYRNITGTLQESGNDWTFEYVRLEEGQAEAPAVTPATTPNAATPTGADENAADATGGDAAAGADAATGADDATTEEAAPPATEEILDMDTPLAAPEGEQAGVFMGSPGKLFSGKVSLLAAIIVIILALLAFFMLRKRDDEKDEK